MNFARGVFIFAFVMLIVGAVGARLIIGPLLFGDTGSPAYVVSSRVSTTTATPRAVPRKSRPRHRVQARPRATATTTAPARLEPTVTAVPQPTHVVPTPARTHSTAAPKATVHRSPVTHHSRAKHIAIRRTATPVPTATTLPTPAPSATPAGTVTLTNYWVGSSTAHPGNTIAVGYVIDNQTGVTEHIELGASVKASNQLSWATDSISDPSHDVVATVPPGISRHVRYFTLSSSLHGGSYDIAWGLRDPSTGDRVALVAAASALRVQGIVAAP